MPVILGIAGGRPGVAPATVTDRSVDLASIIVPGDLTALHAPVVPAVGIATLLDPAVFLAFPDFVLAAYFRATAIRAFTGKRLFAAIAAQAFAGKVALLGGRAFQVASIGASVQVVAGGHGAPGVIPLACSLISASALLVLSSRVALALNSASIDLPLGRLLFGRLELLLRAGFLFLLVALVAQVVARKRRRAEGDRQGGADDGSHGFAVAGDTFHQ